MAIALAMILAACSAPAATVSVKETKTVVDGLKPTESSSGEKVEVEMEDFTFVPAELTVKVGSTVTWTNKDSAGHDVRAADGSWGSESLSKGQSFSKVFDREGTYEYVCTFHPGMQGKIIVTK
jgi:plastocyanin